MNLLRIATPLNLRKCCLVPRAEHFGERAKSFLSTARQNLSLPPTTIPSFRTPPTTFLGVSTKRFLPHRWTLSAYESLATFTN